MRCGCEVHESESDSTGALFYGVDSSHCAVSELVTVLDGVLSYVNPAGLADWACVECKPHSDMIQPGFQCWFHHGKALVAKMREQL